MKKKLLVICLIVLFCAAAVSSAAYIHHRNNQDNTVTVITTLPISAITEKVHSDDYYLTIKMDGWYQEQYKLPSDTISVKSTKSVFEKVEVGNDYIGVCVEINIPADQPRADVGMLIKEDKVGYFKIISLTRGENTVIT